MISLILILWVDMPRMRNEHSVFDKMPKKSNQIVSTVKISPIPIVEIQTKKHKPNHVETFQQNKGLRITNQIEPKEVWVPKDFHKRNQSNLVSFLYYFSTLSGPILSIITGGIFLCIIPIHNALEYPEFWYEDTFFRWIPSCTGTFQNLFGAEYWADFTFKNRGKSYFILAFVQNMVYWIVVVSYYLIWTNSGYFPPMPMCQHLGALTILLVYHVAVYFRWVKNIEF